MNDYDNKFKDYDKKIADLISDKEVESVKANIINISDEIKTVKISMGDIINRLNNNKTEMEEILESIKQKENNFNLMSNMVSISPGNRSARKEGEDAAQIEQMQEDIDDLKHYIDNKLLEINIKLEMISGNNPEIQNFNKNIELDNKKKLPGERSLMKLKTFSPNKYDFDSGSTIGFSQLMKKIEEVDKNHRDLERNFKRLLSSFNVNDILDDIAKLKDAKADKADIPDQDSYNYLLDDIRIKVKKHDNELKELTQRSDNIYSKIIKQERNEENTNIVNLNKEILKNFESKEEFDIYMKPIEEDLTKIKSEFQKMKDYLSQIMNSMKKKVYMTDLTSTKSILNEKIEELARACNIKFADKNECLKNFKHIEEQLKKILFILQKKNEQNSEGDGNWLLAKKPINGYSCAACESFIGELNNDAKKYVPWNRLPNKEGSDNYRLGIGYSKMLQMINFDNNGNINISPENNMEENNTIFTYDSNGMNLITNKNANNFGKTFTIKQKIMPSKTPGKNRVQSAMDFLSERNSNKSMKNINNYLEENKNNNFINSQNTKTRNQKGLPKISNLEGDSMNQKDLKITKIMKKNHSKTNFKLKRTKI